MVTLKDVAEKAGVTVTTVSRVLNNRGYISEKTRTKVYAVMKELNYQPNEIARSLIKKRTNVIGVIVPSVRHPFFCQVVYYLELFAAQNHYKIMLCNSQNEKEKEFEYVEMLKSNKVAGIVISSRTTDIDEYLTTDLPVVSFERPTKGDASAVLCDNFQGGCLATNHLLECGCKNLIHIGSPEHEDMPANQRSVAFSEICNQHGVAHKTYQTTEQQFFEQDYRAIINTILDENPNMDGIFASNDIIAAQVIQQCAYRHISIPDTIQVVGFDDIEFASLSSPAITTIKQPVQQMCELAIRNILNRLQDQIVPSKSILPVTLVKRQSTAWSK